MKCSFLSFLAAASALCSVQSLRAEQFNQLSVKYGIAQYDAKERSATGFVLNHESGQLPFIDIGFRRVLSDRFFLDASYRHADHAIQYAGYTQIGIPLKTRTLLQWQQSSLGLGLSSQLSDSDTLEWRVGLGKRRLDRDIKAGLGSLPLRELLSITQLQVGAKWQKRMNTHTLWHMGLTLHPVLNQSLAVDSFGLYDPITLRLGKQSTDRRITAGLAHRFSSIWQVELHWGMDIMRPQASATEIWKKSGVPQVTVRYPGSQQRMSDVSLQLSAHF